MLEGFLADGAKEALVASVVEIESQTSAEVVVAVRARSSKYLWVEFGVGITVMLGALAFMLFSNRFEFSLLAIFLDPIIAGVIAGLLATQIDPLHRLLVPRHWRRDHARVLAQSIFYRGGVRHTTERVGLLVFFSLLERVAVVVADSGVKAAIEESPEWIAAVAKIDSALANGGTGHEAAEAMRALGPVLSPLLPRSEFDVNELPDEVDA